MNDLVERIRNILSQNTDKWKDASDEDVVESALFLLEELCLTPDMLFDMYSDQFDILEDIDIALTGKEDCMEKLSAIEKLIEQWKEFR